MNRIQKFLKSLNAKEREAVLLILINVRKNFRNVPGLMKLRGYRDLYRIRVGAYRIIFRINEIANEVVRITKRDEQTYKNL